MSTTRVLALGTGWIVMLAGSLACIGAVVMAVAFAVGATFVSSWTFPLMIAAVGFGLMVGALPLMFFGCEARHDIRMNRAVPCNQLAKVTFEVPTMPNLRDIPDLAMSGGGGRHLSYSAVRTFEHRS